jgi:hypothetical protein
VARKGWDALSAQYRKRLEKGGISRADYTAGRSLSKARGHAQTPEHPTDKVDKAKYPNYYAKRQQLIRDFQRKKARLWGHLEDETRSLGRTRFNRKNSFDNVRDGRMSNKLLQWALDADEEDLIDALRDDSETFAFVGYH